MLKPDYKAIWPTMIVSPDKVPAMKLAASHIQQFQLRYSSVGTSTCPSIPVPWYFIGLIHHMESGQNFDRHLYNGDPLSARTVHYPPGRPVLGTPPFTWDFAAQDALRYMGYNDPKVWEIDDVLNRLEEYNGLGYRTYHDMLSPYLFAGTNLYTKGKYDEVWNVVTKKFDVKWSPDEVSNQLGCAGILKYLLV